MTDAYRATFEEPQGNDIKNVELIFSDSEGVIGNILEEQFLRDILDIADIYKHYTIEGRLKEVEALETYEPPRDVRILVKSAEDPFIIIGEETPEKLIAFLCRRVKAGAMGNMRGVFMAGIWPKEFADECKKNSLVYNRVIENLGRFPDRWRRVIILTKQGQDMQIREKQINYDTMLNDYMPIDPQ